MREQGLPSLASPSRTRRRAGLACLTLTFALAARVHALDPQKSITQFTHTAWSAKDGIPGPVRAIAQTRDGYLWLGTEAGLYRFDGLRFAPYEHSSAHPHGPAVLSLLAARDGSLWMGFGSGGIGLLRDGQFTHFPPGEGVPAGGILSVVEDAAGSIWAAGQYGLASFQNGKWRRVGTEMGYAAPAAQALLVDQAGTLWVATDGLNFGLSRDPVRVNTILALARNATRFSPTGDAVGMIWSMAEAPDGAVWLADTTGKKARPIDPRGGASRGVALDQETMGLSFGNDRSIWIGLLDGGLRRARDMGRDAPLDRFGVKDELSGSMVNAALTDREGNLWFGTGGGLDRFRENKVTPFSESEGLVPDQAIALASTPDGSVWLVSYARDTVRRFQDGKFVGSTLVPYSSSDSSRILSLYASPAGQVWLGGSFKLAKEDHGTFSYVDIPGVESGAMVEAVAEDKAGDLWVTISTGSVMGRILRRRGGEWTDLRAQTALPPYRSRVLHADAVGRMWLGFENGDVVVFEGDASRLYSTKNGLRSGKVLVIAGDREGHVLIGGEGGLSRFAQDRFVTLTQDNGLPGSSVSGVVEDDDGNLWLAGALGILRVKPRELDRAFASASYRLEGVTFDATDGLRGLPRQRAPFPTATRAADGRLWFSTTGGIAVIDPRRWPRNALAPPVKIERVIADDRNLEASAGLRLLPNTKRLELQYAALSLTAPERVRFRYKLEGYDADWRGPVSARSATYTNLPPRDYRFHVIACNNDGVWNEEGAALEFAIVPAFYQTRAFLLLCAAAAACLVWAGFRLRMRQVRSRLQLQFRERLAERTRIAQELHDTLLQGFLSASMQLHVAVEHVPAESPDKPRLSRVLELMRGVIEEGRNAVRGLRPSGGNHVDLEEAFSRVREELNAKEGIDFRVIGEGQAHPLDAVIRDEVYRIGREAVINAFQHSDANRIEVEVEFAAKGLRIAVRDDGRGIDPQLLQSGREGHWGLTGMRERADRIGANLRVWSRAGSGTEVELSVPGGIAFQAQSRRRPWGWLARLYPGRAGDLDARKRES
jgi:signal transduction histidine kinase/ligand-binding sensor domain-containing protein